MAAKKSASRHISGSDLMRSDAHTIKASEYEELLELTAEMLQSVTIKKAGRPRSANLRQFISLRLPLAVIARWKATDPGWQTRAWAIHSR